MWATVFITYCCEHSKIFLSKVAKQGNVQPPHGDVLFLILASTKLS